VIGTSAVVTTHMPDNAVIAGIPARVIRMREWPRTLRWQD
jgi:acetyltransferase-like isoleucine patch superfamily enzyme